MSPEKLRTHVLRIVGTVECLAFRLARKLRVEYEGAIYHVMNRGDRREAIFLNDEDRHLFIKAVAEA